MTDYRNQIHPTPKKPLAAVYRADNGHTPAFTPHAPTECIRCFAPQPKCAKDYDAFACRCETCGHTWRERLPLVEGL